MGVELLLFDREDDASPARVVPLDPFLNRSYHYWHFFLPDVQGGRSVAGPTIEPVVALWLFFGQNPMAGSRIPYNMPV